MKNSAKPVIIEKNGILKSYLIGLPTGILSTLFFISLPTMVTGEGLVTIIIISIYERAILGLLLSFLVVLGFAGHFAAKKIKNGTGLLATSFFYCFIVNTVIWSVFILVLMFDNYHENMEIFYWYLPVILYIVCTFLSTFTVGIIICGAIKPEQSELSANKY